MKDQEINTYLGKNLMGWKLESVNRSTVLYWVEGGKETARVRYEECDWNPIADITQALGDGGPGTVVGAMRGTGWVFSIFGYSANTAKEYSVTFSKPFKEISGYAENDNPARAVCLAAVEALKGQESGK